MNRNTYIYIALVALAAYLLFKKFTGGLQNIIASSPFGFLTGTRSLEGSKAAEWLSKCKWLTEYYYEILEPKYNKPRYIIDYFGTELSNNIAQEIIAANSLIPGGFLDNPTAVVNAVMQITNQAQALEVQRSYFLDSRAHKNLSNGLSWLPDRELIEIVEHFKSLPSGVFDRELNKNVPKLV